MADPRDELDPTQATEAKLCAYLEGTLSAADRVEIEKYLAQSPTHRKLLRDLASTRRWVSELPKELAPPEIAELFEQHAERTMLLDDSASAVSVRINRGPQVMLAAAILLLAVGLGAIIFIVLNAKGPTAQNYVSSMKSPAAAPVDSASPKRATPTTSPAAGRATHQNDLVGAPAPAPAVIPAAPAAGAGGRGGILPGIVDGSPALASPALSNAQQKLQQNIMPAIKPLPATLPVQMPLATIPPAFAQNQAATTQRSQSLAMNTAAIRQATSEPMTLFNNAVTSATATEITVLTARQNSTTQAKQPTPTTQPATVAIGDRLSVDIPQLVGPGVEKTTTVRVEPDGKITLPMLDAMPAAGKSTNDLQKLIADRYREENLIASPVVTVTRVMATPATMPATQPSTQPTTRPKR